MPSPQQPIELGPAVIEFGSAPDDARPPRRRSLSGFGRALARDHRVVPLAVVLGAIAAFASLISEWQVTTVDAAALGGGEFGRKVLPTDLADLGAFGGGYLTGLFLLVVAVVLTLFGPPAGRRYARLAGLAVGGALLGVLVAMTTLLGDQSRIFSRLYTAELGPDQVTVSYGRGLWCALAAAILTTAALYLAGRRLAGVPAGRGAEEAAGISAPDAIWSWRRPRDQDQEDVPEAPFDLTVSSAQPFTPRADSQDRPGG